MLIALSERPSISFTQLQRIVKTNCGSLSLHAGRLERFGYITIEKTFVDRMPRTEYALTDEGRAALLQYLVGLDD
jgi:DNA-binding MarR family transcriptional regulator